MRARLWIVEGDEVYLYNNHYRVRVWATVPGVGTGAMDLSTRACRNFAHSLLIAAELADERGKK